jgi:ribose transport system substrate-binding protein
MRKYRGTAEVSRTNPKPAGLSTLDKGLTVLEAVEKAAQPATIQDLARATGIQRLAVYRLLTTLERRGYVVRDASKQYRAASRRRRVLAGYAAPLSGNWFRVDLAASLRGAAEKAGVELMVLDNGEDDVAAAMENTERLVSAGADVVIFFQPVESTGHIMADRLFGAGIPFITVERPIQGGVYYGANNYQAGKLAGVALGKFAQSAWKSRFDRVVLLETARTSTNVQARVAGVLVGLREVLGPLEESQVIHLDGKAHLEQSQEAMGALLKRLAPGTKLLISGFNDMSAVGALRAVRAAGRESEVAIVGQNAAREGRAEIRRRNSRMIASVAYFPEKYGANLIRLASDIAAGRPAPPAMYTDHLVLDRKNIDRIYPAAESS